MYIHCMYVCMFISVYIWLEMTILISSQDKKDDQILKRRNIPLDVQTSVLTVSHTPFN